METYTRQQLHDLVWAAPMRDVAKKLGLSDNGLRKHCVKAFVPLPPQGHWNRVKEGQTVKTNPLPARPPGISNTISIGPWDYQLHQKRLIEEDPTPPVFDEAIETLRGRVSRNLGQVLASKSLSPPHAAFRRQVEDDARRSTESSWHTPIFNSPVEKRRLRILQGLFFGLSRLDCSVEVRGREARDIHVTVGHQHVKIEVDRVQSRRRSNDDKAPERIKFSIAGHRGERMSWTDTDERPLEMQLNSIATEIIVAGELQYREHQIWLYEDRVDTRERLKQDATRREAELENAERDRVIALAAARIKRLTDSAESHRRAAVIRTFVVSVIEASADKADPERVQRWKVWALSQADKIDPIATGTIWGDVSERD